MAMDIEMQEPESEPATLRLAKLMPVLSGSITDPRAELTVNLFAQQLTRTLQQRNLSYSFPISGEEIKIGDFHIEISGLEDGSIKATFYLIGKVLLGSYTVVAAYPSFKDALPEIKADIEYVLEEAAGYFQTELPYTDIEYQGTAVVLKKEDELEAQLEQFGGENFLFQ